MQILVNGLLQGMLIGVIGIAFALVYRIAKVFHIALGGLVALAPYLILVGVEAGLPGIVALPLAVLVVSWLGILVEEWIHRPLSDKCAPLEVHLIGSLGAYLIIIACIALLWGSETRVLRIGLDETWSIAGVTLARAQLLGPALTLLAVAVLFIWLGRANRGLELRALADNPVLVALLGRHVYVLRRWVFGLSAAVAAVAASAQAWDVGFDPHVGLKAVLLGMVAMIIGGNGSFFGPLVGGILLGVLRAEMVWYASARWEEAVTFALLAAFLFFRPNGLLGRRTRLEEAA